MSEDVDTEADAGREPITIVEIDQDFCSLRYGVSPCTAAVGVTGGRKCFNTLPTCQDTSNYDKGNLTLRFSTPTSAYPQKLTAIPIITSVSTNPTQLNVGGGDLNNSPLGLRATVKVQMRDIPYNDRLVDPYRTDRGYNPEDKGMFWSKWLARNLYYQNRAMRIYEGYVGQDLSQMQTRHYFIDKITGPDSNGRVEITAKDVLKFADNKKSQCPKANTGVLDEDIDDIDTSFDISPTGIGAEEYPASGYAIIGDELVDYTRSSDTITLVERGLRGTSASDHDEGDSFQEVKVFDTVRVDSVIKELLEDFADVPSEYIPFTDWQAEAARWLADYDLTAWITDPTGVNKLLGEILQQCICNIWWDDIDQEIKFKPMRPVDPSIDTTYILNEDANIIAESLKTERDADQRISQVWIYYNQYNPVENLDEPSNFGRLSINADLTLEGEDKYGESRVRKIFSRWFTTDNSGQVITTSANLLFRYGINPLYVTLSLDAKDRAIKVGDVVRITHRALVDDTGEPFPTILQVIRRLENDPGHRVEYRCQIFGFVNRYGYIMANGSPDYDDATEDEREEGMWISEDDEPYFSDATDAYRII